MELIPKIFGSYENFLQGKVSETWGNAGYTTKNVEANSFIKNYVDLVKWSALLSVNVWKGFKGLKTTRYMYNYIQNVTPIESNHIPDLIQTYASIGVMRGEDPSITIQESLKKGRGIGLKRYHQYSKRRFKNRQWKWKAYKLGNTNNTYIVFNKTKFLSTLNQDKRYKIISTTTNFHEDNQYFLHWLQENGQDSFNNVEVSLDNRPIDKSIGITLWESNSTPIKSSTYTNEVSLVSRDSFNGIKVGESTTVKLFNIFLNPYDIEPENEFSSLVDVYQEELDVNVKVTLLSKNYVFEGLKRKYNYTYRIEEIQDSYDYTKELHYYLLESGSSNYSNFQDYWIFPEDKLNILGEQSSDDSNSFDFIAPIPIKDWFSGKGTWTQTLPKLTKEDGIVKAIKDLSDLTKDLYEDKHEETSDSSSIGKRETSKLERKNIKENKEVTYNKLGSEDESTTNKSTRSIQRFVTRELNRSRHLDFNKDSLADIKDYDPRRLKRHIEHLSSLVGIDYMQYCAGLMSQSHWDGGHERTNTYQSSIYLGSIFSNQTIENHHYWYEWAKRQYNLYGKEDSFNQWVSSVHNAQSESDLPIHVVKYQTTDKTHWGGYSFAFITKFEIDGRVRKIKKKRRLHDILRGKPMTIGSLNHLKEVIEPKRELARDIWWESKVSGKEYPIGGEKFAGLGYTEGSEPTIRQILQNFSYTLFCKNSGNGKITCYAICGLQFHTKMSEREFWATAWYDLGMEFERIKQEKVDKKKRDSINVVMEVETGSRKYRHINMIYNFGIVPLDYNVIRRMNPTLLENFAQRATLNYSFLFLEQKKKRSGIKYVRPIVTVVGFIIAVIFALPTGGSSFAAYAYAVAVAVAVSVIVSISIKHLIMPLLKSLGLKGITALIVILVILILAYMAGADASQSALPYASETTGKVGTEVGNEVAKETVKQSTQQSVQQTLTNIGSEISKEVIKQLVGSNLPQLLGNAINYTAQLTDIQNQEEMKSLQRQAEIAQQEYESAIKDLTEKQEEFQQRLAQYDTRAVLESIRQPKYTKDIDLLWEQATANINALGSYEYLTSFLEQKLNLDVETFDPISSTDFTFKT